MDALEAQMPEADTSPPAPVIVPESRSKIYAALAKAQSEITMPKKNRTVVVKTDKGQYTFNYATLDEIIDTVREPLTKNGLWFLHSTEVHPGGPSLMVCTLIHDSGQTIRSEAPIDLQKGRHQDIGSAMSYLRRYTLIGLLGIAGEDDDDANVADANSVVRQETKPPPKPWTGPLGKVQFKAAYSAVLSDVKTAETTEALDELLARLHEGNPDDKENFVVGGADLIKQCRVDAPNWWNGYGDIIGLKTEIAKKRDELKRMGV